MSEGPFVPAATDRQGSAPPQPSEESHRHLLSRLILATAIVLSALTALALVTLDFVEWRQQRGAALSRVATKLQTATEDYFAGYAELFHAVAETDVLHSRDAAAGSAFFRRLQEQFPEVANIAAAGADGHVFASSRPLAAEPPNVSGLPFFRELAGGAPLYVMDAHTGPISGETVTGFAFPLRDAQGRLTGVLGASVALTELSRIWDAVTLPAGYAFTILDRNGFPLFTDPEFSLTFEEVHELRQASDAAPAAREGFEFRKETVPVAEWTLLATAPYGKVPDYLGDRPLVWGLGLSILLLSTAGLLLAGRQGHLCRRLYENKEQLRRHGEELEKQIEARTAELAASEGRYRQIIETAQEGIWVIDTAGDATFVNPHMAAMLGYGEGEMEGKSVFAFIDEEDHPAARQHLVRRRTGLSDRCEFRFRRKDGSFLWTFMSVTPLFDAEGGYAGCLGMVMDISERLQIERDLRNSRRLLKLILDSLPTRVFWKDRELKYLGGNEAFARDAGLASPEDLVGRDDFDLWQEHAERYRADDRRVIESGKALLGFEEPQPNPEGRMLRVRTCKLPLLDADENVVGIIGTYEDITEQKDREEHLRFLATHDALTGLANRTLLHDRIDQAIHFAQRAGRVAAVLLLDLDGFKEINDTLGHDFGDKLLCTAAQRLKQSVRETDTVARLGGDEFVVVLAQVVEAQPVHKVAQKILANLTAPCRIDGRDINLSSSLGISLYPTDAADSFTLLRYADAAMYRAKKQGRTSIAFYSDDDAG